MLLANQPRYLVVIWRMGRKYESPKPRVMLYRNLQRVKREDHPGQHVRYVKYLFITVFFFIIFFFYVVVGPKDTAPEDVFRVTFQDYEKFLPFIYASVRNGQKKI